MKPDDPSITWIEEPKLGLAGRMYLPLLVEGLHDDRAALVQPESNGQFPGRRPKIGNPLIYRGVHRLNKDERGRVKCVACFLCATACPAHCIDIVAAESPWPDREKYPQSFAIDELRCIYLRHVRRSMPGRCHRADEPARSNRPQPRGNDFRQGKAAQRVRHDKDAEPMKSAGAGRHRMMGAILADFSTLCARGLILAEDAAPAGWAASGRVGTESRCMGRTFGRNRCGSCRRARQRDDCLAPCLPSWHWAVWRLNLCRWRRGCNRSVLDFRWHYGGFRHLHGRAFRSPASIAPFGCADAYGHGGHFFIGRCSFWEWRRLSFMPVRSWSHSCSCSCSPSRAATRTTTA